MSLLEVDGISVRFGGNMAVNNVTLTAEASRVTGLIGPNGAGKTTLFNVVTGLQAPTGGQVHLDGRDITPLKPFKRARLGMARTFQRLELFGLLTVRENLAVAADIRRGWAHRQPAAEATKETPAETAERLISEIGLEAVADVRADALPTGQARLVELGRALATRPRLLLLDEPASGQDEQETARFAALLRQLAARGIAVLLVEHDMSLVMDVCEVIHVLDFGTILATGTPDEVRHNDAVLAAYLGSGPGTASLGSGAVG
jgi:branched-chain amino acid transport system ATP-binding protein